jgi:uncharacterized protein YjbI with pentapeptide repeats
MKITRPQTCALVCSPCQIGGEHTLGISIAFGWLLGEPERLVHEARLWAAIAEASPSLPVLDAAEPKPHAEWLVAATARASRPGTLARVVVHVGDSSRVVDVPDGLPVPMAPVAPWDDTRGCFLPGKDAYNSHYLETCYPGYPASLDRRYFQMAPATQWLDAGAWPDRVPYLLCGVTADGSNHRGEVPSLRVRAMTWCDASEEAPLGEIPMTRKTLWFLPAEGLGLVVFNGAISLAHGLDEPPAELMIGIEEATSPRSTRHYQQVRLRRRDPSTGALASMLDDELLPAGVDPEIIQSLSDHPSSILHRPGGWPAGAAAAHFASLRQARDEVSRIGEIQTAPGGENARAAPGCRGDGSAADSARMATSDASFNDVRLTGKALAGRRFERVNFRHCTLSGVHFDDAVFEHCLFADCVLDDCSFADAKLEQVRIEHCAISRCDWSRAEIDTCFFTQTRYSDSVLEQSLLRCLSVTDCTFNRCSFAQTRMEDSAWASSTLDHAGLDGANVTTTTFIDCTTDGLRMHGGRLEACSIFSGKWIGIHASECVFDRVTFGAPVDLSAAIFDQVQFIKTGMTAATLRGARFTDCSGHELSLMRADLTGVIMQGCDFPGAMLRQATLAGAQLKNCCLPDGLLHGVDLAGASVRGCDLSAADLAMSVITEETRIEDCLLLGARLNPRHPDARGAA